MLHKTKEPEYMALKVVALLRMNRPDLAEATLKQMKT
jgi:hypothetical protein